MTPSPRGSHSVLRAGTRPGEAPEACSRPPAPAGPHTRAPRSRPCTAAAATARGSGGGSGPALLGSNAACNWGCPALPPGSRDMGHFPGQHRTGRGRNSERTASSPSPVSVRRGQTSGRLPLNSGAHSPPQARCPLTRPWSKLVRLGAPHWCLTGSGSSVGRLCPLACPPRPVPASARSRGLPPLLHVSQARASGRTRGSTYAAWALRARRGAAPSWAPGTLRYEPAVRPGPRPRGQLGAHSRCTGWAPWRSQSWARPFAQRVASATRRLT